MKSIGPAMVLLLATVAYGDSPELIANFSTAIVTIDPDTDPERRIALPALEFDFKLTMNCGAVREANRVSVSVADTRQSFDITTSDDRRNLAASLVVPAEQIAPVATQGFCVLDDPTSLKTVSLPGILTSQISLLCGSEQERAMHFVSTGLEIRLVCSSAETNQPSLSTVR